MCPEYACGLGRYAGYAGSVGPAGGCFDDQPAIVAELVWKVEGGSLSCLGALTLRQRISFLPVTIAFCIKLHFSL